MDGILHQFFWNLPGPCQAHHQILERSKLWNAKHLKLVLPKGVLTFILAQGNGISTTINLVWVNSSLVQMVLRCEVLAESFGLKHQALWTAFNLFPPFPPPLCNTAAKITSLDLLPSTTDIKCNPIQAPTSLLHYMKEISLHSVFKCQWLHITKHLGNVSQLKALRGPCGQYHIKSWSMSA